MRRSQRALFSAGPLEAGNTMLTFAVLSRAALAGPPPWGWPPGGGGR
ncbi:MAG: hypothetical protein ACREPI_12915 [Candidatus Dormibacterales bacterium]